MASPSTAARLLALTAAVGAVVAAASDDADTVVLTPLTIAGKASANDHPPATHVLTPGDAPVAWNSAPGLTRQLSGLPGVVMQDGFGGIDPPRISMRGSGLQSAPVSRGILWSLDGNALNAADGSFNSAVFDPAVFGAVAVETPTRSREAAGHVLGGSIRMYSHQPDAPPEAWLTVGGDGFLRAAANGPIQMPAATSDAGSENPAQVRVSVAHAAWDGWREHSAQRRTTALTRLVHRWRAGGPRLAATVYATNPALDIPGPLVRADALQRPRSVSAVVAVDQPRRETTFVHASAALEWDDATDAGGRLSVTAQHTDDWFRQLRANGIGETRGTDLGVAVGFFRDLGAHRLDGSVGLRAGTREQQRWVNSAGAAGPRFADLTLEATQLTGWLEDTWQLAPRLGLRAGSAFAASSRAARGSPLPVRGQVTDRAALPHISLRWEPDHGLEVSVRVARAFEAPTLDDLVSTRTTSGAPTAAWSSLRHQNATTAELGLASERGPLAASVTLFDGRWTDELLRLADATGASLGTVNAAKTRHSGIESAVRWRLLDREGQHLDLAAAHTWSRAVFDEGIYRGRHLAGLPAHAGAAHLSWSGAGRFFASVSARWISGPTWADHANRLAYPGHTILDARAGFRLRPGCRAFVEIDNCLDRRIIASTSGVVDIARNPPSTALFLPGLPRQVRIGLTLTR